MAFFTYHGDQKSTEVFGVSFEADKATEVEDKPANLRAIVKLRGNPDFTESVDGVEIAATEDHGAEAEVDALRVEAERMGVKVDKRWKEARLREAIAEAKAGASAWDGEKTVR